MNGRNKEIKEGRMRKSEGQSKDGSQHGETSYSRQGGQVRDKKSDGKKKRLSWNKKELRTGNEGI